MWSSNCCAGDGGQGDSGEHAGVEVMPPVLQDGTRILERDLPNEYLDFAYGNLFLQDPSSNYCQQKCLGI